MNGVTEAIVEPVAFLAFLAGASFVVAFVTIEDFRHATVRAVVAWWREVIALPPGPDVRRLLDEHERGKRVR